MSKRKKFEYSDRWICHWPDGSRAAVFGAETVEDAIEVLDELGAAEPWMLTRIDDSRPCFVDFDKAPMGFDASYVSEELYAEVEKRRKLKRADVAPVNQKAADLSKVLGMSQSLANRMVIEAEYEAKMENGGLIQ